MDSEAVVYRVLSVCMYVRTTYCRSGSTLDWNRKGSDRAILPPLTALPSFLVR